MKSGHEEVETLYEDDVEKLERQGWNTGRIQLTHKYNQLFSELLIPVSL
jgi:hypothetical protein